MHDVERVAGLPHVEARQRTPGAANSIKGAIFAIVQHVEVLEGLFDKSFRFFQRFAGDVLQGQPAQWQSHAATHTRAVNIDELKRSATKISDDTIRLMNAGNDAKRGEMSLPLA